MQPLATYHFQTKRGFSKSRHSTGCSSTSIFDQGCNEKKTSSKDTSRAQENKEWILTVW